MRLLALLLALSLLIACTEGEGAQQPSTPIGKVTASRAVSAPSRAQAPGPSLTTSPTDTPAPLPTPYPTVSPTPIPIYHPPPYVIAIDAGHGGPFYWGGSARDNDGRQYIEKDWTLEVALKLRDWLLTDEQRRYIPVLVRDGDYTLTYFDAGDYASSQGTELQARVDVANASTADVLLSIHFNGWHDPGESGTETYCNPDRSFALEGCQFASFVQNRLVSAIRDHGHDIRDRGTRNDAEVGGDPANPHSYLLGTNYAFNPSLMPGVISEILFLSNPTDLEFLKNPDAIDVLGQAYKWALDDYFGWLVPPP